jgi:hypothetical protein
VKNVIRFVRIKGKRLVFGTAHGQLAIACTPKFFDCEIELKPNKLAVAKRKRMSFGREIEQRWNIHQHAKRFWVLVPEV